MSESKGGDLPVGGEGGKVVGEIGPREQKGEKNNQGKRKGRVVGRIIPVDKNQLTVGQAERIGELGGAVLFRNHAIGIVFPGKPEKNKNGSNEPRGKIVGEIGPRKEGGEKND